MKKIFIVVFSIFLFIILINTKINAKTNFNVYPGIEKLYLRDKNARLLNFYTSKKNLNEKDYTNKQAYENDLKERQRYFDRLSYLKNGGIGLFYEYLNKDVEVKFLLKTNKIIRNDTNSDEKIKYNFETGKEKSVKLGISGSINNGLEGSFPIKPIALKAKSDLKLSADTVLQKQEKVVEKLEFIIPKQTVFINRQSGSGLLTNGIFSFNIFKSVYSADFEIIRITSLYEEILLEAI